MRFTLIATSLGAMILLLIFGFLLLTAQTNSDTPRNQDVIPIELEVPKEASLSQDVIVVPENPNVSREDMTDERPLGTDANMEFPTLEE